MYRQVVGMVCALVQCVGKDAGESVSADSQPDAKGRKWMIEGEMTIGEPGRCNEREC